MKSQKRTQARHRAEMNHLQNVAKALPFDGVDASDLGRGVAATGVASSIILGAGVGAQALEVPDNPSNYALHTDASGNYTDYDGDGYADFNYGSRGAAQTQTQAPRSNNDDASNTNTTRNISDFAEHFSNNPYTDIDGDGYVDYDYSIGYTSNAIRIDSLGGGSTASTQNNTQNGSTQQTTANQGGTNVQTASVVSSGNNSGIIGTAQAGLGVPYVWGGSTTGGWDCGGYVSWVLNQNGYSVPSNGDTAIASALQAQGAYSVSQSQAVAGDIVWIPGQHIGIYGGNGTVYEAQNPSSGTVLDTYGWSLQQGAVILHLP